MIFLYKLICLRCTVLTQFPCPFLAKPSLFIEITVRYLCPSLDEC